MRTWLAAFRVHRADAVLDALTEAGALLPAGGQTTQHLGFYVGAPHNRPIRCYNPGTCNEHEHRYTQQRTEWPDDGSVYYGPWQEVPTDG